MEVFKSWGRKEGWRVVIPCYFSVVPAIAPAEAVAQRSRSPLVSFGFSLHLFLLPV